MDLGALIGLILAPFVVVVVGMGVDSIDMFIDIPSLAIVVGGGIASSMIAMPFGVVLNIPAYFGIFITEKAQSPKDIIKDIVEYAEIARRDGILALENKMADIKNEFLQKGVQLAVDGTDPELIRQILESEMESIDERHKDGKNLMGKLNSYLPAWGMVGTLVGLVKMLANLDDPDSIGPSMAIALITTFYGSFFANYLAGPIGDKLDRKNTGEMLLLNIILQGVMSIQQGDNPRIVKQKLEIYMPPKERDKEEK